ncbi:MAG: class I SAM-dependent methyltransferase [Bacteroidetes bacterium]|nr:class I SAM-dependent methyltransferase [Bacteroidota bacterium]
MGPSSQAAIRYIKHRFRSKSRFELHSPFVYKIYSEILTNKTSIKELQAIEKTRRKLHRDPGYIKMSDMGAGAGDIPWCHKLVPVKQVISRSCVSAPVGRILFRLVKQFQPAVMVELGTSIGMSTSYLATGNPMGEVITVEGCAETAEAARKNFEHLGLSNIRQVVGAFDEVLPLLLRKLGKVDLFFIDGNHRKTPSLNYFNQCLQHIHNDSVLILDDIHWSEEMEEAWDEIRAHPSVTVTIDLFRMGLVFFNTGLSKEDFILHL